MQMTMIVYIFTKLTTKTYKSTSIFFLTMMIIIEHIKTDNFVCDEV